MVPTVVLVFAQGTPTPPAEPPAGGNIANLASSIDNIIMTLRGIVLAAGTVVVIYAGIRYILGAFSPDEVGAAKTILTTTILGLIFLLLYPTIIDVLSKQGLLPPLHELPSVETPAGEEGATDEAEAGEGESGAGERTPSDFWGNIINRDGADSQ